MTSARSKLPRVVRRYCAAVAHTRPLLLLVVRREQVAEQGLRPDMALRACNNPTITKSALSREITKLVIVHAEAEVGRLLQARKADATDAAGGLVSFARGNGGTGPYISTFRCANLMFLDCVQSFSIFSTAHNRRTVYSTVVTSRYNAAG